jgi:hypothetical protein
MKQGKILFFKSPTDKQSDSQGIAHAKGSRSAGCGSQSQRASLLLNGDIKKNITCTAQGAARIAGHGHQR